jgi:hypothetical protein
MEPNRRIGEKRELTSSTCPRWATPGSACHPPLAESQAGQGDGRWMEWGNWEGVIGMWASQQVLLEVLKLRRGVWWRCDGGGAGETGGSWKRKRLQAQANSRSIVGAAATCNGSSASLPPLALLRSSVLRRYPSDTRVRRVSRSPPPMPGWNTYQWAI